MPSERVRVLNDLEAMRAVANPLRLEILEMLREHETLTASQCAQLLGTTPKSCSYHLHVLARSQLVEEVAHGDRRERPWRLTYDIAETPEEGSGEMSEAVDNLLRLSIEHNFRALIKYIATRQAESEAWQNAAAATGRIVRFTADELRHWAADVEEVTREHTRRARSEPNEGRRRVRLLVNGFPDTDGPSGDKVDSSAANPGLTQHPPSR